MEANLAATFDAGTSFNNKLKDTIQGLLGANNERVAEIAALRGDHDQLKSDHDALENTTTRENDLRKNEVKSLEERTAKDNQSRITDIAKLDGKLDSENNARKEEIKALDGWAKGENDSRKTEIANIKNFAESENDARKTAIANLDNFAKSENDGRKADIAAVNARADAEAAARDGEDKALSERISKEVSDREAAVAEQQARGDSHNEERIGDIDALKTKMIQENAFLKSLSGKTLGVYFNAYRTKAYDGGGEENLTFQGTYCNVGGGLDTDTGIFTCPTGGTYMFQFHIATHDNKKALLSIRKNGEEIASIFDQNHKDNHKNSMAGQNIIMDVKRGDEIVVYAYTGTWLADFPMNHYTHWVGLLLKPSEEEIEALRKASEEA
eukprot:TRINITY_DN215_c0_g1_i1.p1 TRINITY_DN215_c0_g1~~TRINITY_DN215_c0_g1_i1.p1  ORF type:complete len:435 (-),score=142.71 TRINITY_DN215_c0_g1_i1:317-1465(-)